MSGNMSFVSSSDTSRTLAREGSGTGNSSRSTGTLTSTQDETIRGKAEPTVHMKDVWSTRIILSALEEVAFAESPFPKLPPALLSTLQKFILSVNASAADCNPFVQFSKSPTIEGGRSSGLDESQQRLGLSTEEVLETVTSESKVVLRSLVYSYVRNTASCLVKKFQPLSSYSASRKQGGGAEVDFETQESFDCILRQLQLFQQQSAEAEDEIKQLWRQREEELTKYEKDIKKFDAVTREVLTKESAQRDPEFAKQYAEFLDLEIKCLEQQIRLETLQKEAEENPEDLRRATNETYNALKAHYVTLLEESEDFEKKAEEYVSLGGDYMKIFDKYTSLEEAIKTKEWVKEQLMNGPHDDSLLGDSFYE